MGLCSEWQDRCSNPVGDILIRHWIDVQCTLRPMRMALLLVTTPPPLQATRGLHKQEEQRAS